MHAYIHSLERYRDAFDWVYPSHGSFPVSPDLIPALREAAGRILAGEVQGTEVEKFGHRIMRYDVGVAVFLGGGVREGLKKPEKQQRTMEYVRR